MMIEQQERKKYEGFKVQRKKHEARNTKKGAWGMYGSVGRT
jgi:hypothetical protein